MFAVLHILIESQWNLNKFFAADCAKLSTILIESQWNLNVTDHMDG